MHRLWSRGTVRLWAGCALGVTFGLVVVQGCQPQSPELRSEADAITVNVGESTLMGWEAVLASDFVDTKGCAGVAQVAPASKSPWESALLFKGLAPGQCSVTI